MSFGLTSKSNSWEGDSGSSLVFGDMWTTLDAGLDVGINWQVSERINFFAGTSVHIFDWTTWAETGETFVANAANLEPRLSLWSFTGLYIEDINLGMTFTPVENVVIGLGLNSFVNGLFGQQVAPTFDFTISARLP
jgi:hypothetical protein